MQVGTVDMALTTPDKSNLCRQITHDSYTAIEENLNLQLIYDHENKVIAINFAWNERLLKILKIAIISQYQLACLSTLGGAYHLCNKPVVALRLAREQEAVGIRIGSTSIVIRSRVYQAVNLGLLGRARQAKKLFLKSRLQSIENGSHMLSFCDAVENWFNNYLLQIQPNEIKAITYDDMK